MSDFKTLWKKAKKGDGVPIYDYICGRCKKFYEYFHVNSQDKKAICPHCGSNDAKKQVSKGTSFQLKGGGWAKDRYGK